MNNDCLPEHHKSVINSVFVYSDIQNCLEMSTGFWNTFLFGILKSVFSGIIKDYNNLDKGKNYKVVKLFIIACLKCEQMNALHSNCIISKSLFKNRMCSWCYGLLKQCDWDVWQGKYWGYSSSALKKPPLYERPPPKDVQIEKAVKEATLGSTHMEDPDYSRCQTSHQQQF